MQVTTSSSPLFSSWESRDSQGPAAPDPMATMGLAGQDIAPAAPSTLVGYNKPLLVDDGALALVGHNKPLQLDTIAAPSTTAANSPTPKADPLEIAALELLLAEPANQDMVQRFGGPLQPLPTDTATGQGIQARYGADLGARLNQLQAAQQAVRAEYCKAMDSAMQSPGPDTPGSVYVPEVRVPADSASPARWDFDPAAFTRQYTSGDNPAQQAFAQLHGSDPLQYRQGRDMDGAAPSAHILDSYTLAQGYTNPDESAHNAWTGTRLEQPEHLLSPEQHTKLINKENLWFDPVHGWSTEAENLKGNLLDRALPMVVMGAITGFMLPPLQAGMSHIGMGTVAQGAVAGAASSAVIQLVTTGKVNFGTLLRSALTAGAATGIMDASGMGDMLKSPQLDTRALGHLGKAGMQGVLQEAIGGKFKDGFTNSLLASAASEVGAHLDQQIAEQLPDLGPAQASALKLLGRAATSALRIVGSNDPAASFANDFLMGALQDTVAQGKQGKEGQEGAQQSGIAQGGEKPSNDWLDRLGRSGLGPRISDEALSAWSDEIDGGIALNGGMAPSQINQAVVGPNQGPLHALAAAGLDAQQQRAMYGQLLANGQIQLNAQGVPIVQPGQVLEFDLSDMGGSTLGGNAIGRESAMRAQRQTAAEQQYSLDNRDAKDIRAGFSYQSMLSRGLSEADALTAVHTDARSATYASQWDGVNRQAPAETYLRSTLGGLDPVRGSQWDNRVARSLPEAAVNELGGLALGRVLGGGAELIGGALRSETAALNAELRTTINSALGRELGLGAPMEGVGTRIGNAGNVEAAVRPADVPEWIQSLNFPSRRHYADTVSQKTLAKELNTVIDNSVDVASDVNAIRNGQATLENGQFLVNGRIYGYHDGALYPISGQGFYPLDRGAFKALGVYNRFGNTDTTTTILDNMGVDLITRRNALLVWSRLK